MKFTDESQAAIADVIKHAGACVKEHRQLQRLSRRELSERSGVSPRYLVQLESGEGNISIGLLKSVALALGIPMTSLLEDAATNHDENLRIGQLFAEADDATRAEVLRLLDPEQSRYHKAERVCLIGLRGAGKSTLGSMIAHEFGMPFIELNAIIEQKAGMPIGEILALYGQEGYRELEANALNDVITEHQHVVLAAAGGIVADEATFAQVLSHFHTVWLKALPDEHMSRVQAQGDHRPMEGRPEAMQQLKQILQSREQQYAQAEYMLDTSMKTEKDACQDLAQLLISNHIIERASS